MKRRLTQAAAVQSNKGKKAWHEGRDNKEKELGASRGGDKQGGKKWHIGGEEKRNVTWSKEGQ